MQILSFGALSEAVMSEAEKALSAEVRLEMLIMVASAARQTSRKQKNKL